MLISVIIPNYNHALYLNQRIESVLNQTYQNFEVIILDDCSTDNSSAILSKFKNHPKVSHVVFNEHNSGSTFKQWQKGFELAKGDWIWIAESDDWCEPGLLAELMSPVDTNKDIVVSFCQSVVVNTENKILYTTNWDVLSSVLDGSEFLRKYMLVTNRIQNAGMAIFKKSCIANVPGDYMTMKFCGDWFFWINLCMQGKVYISGKYLNYYLRHNNNVATLAIKKGIDFLEGNKIFDFIVSKLNVSPKEKEIALDMITDKYLTAKVDFLSNEIHNDVFRSMVALDPTMEGLIEKKIRQKKTNEVRSSVKRILRLPFFS